MIIEPIKIVVYKTKTGKSPFFTWRDKLELGARAVIRTRLDRVSVGGDKASQNRDIEKAKQYWLEYKEQG